MQTRTALILATAGLAAALGVGAVLVLASRPPDDGPSAHGVLPVLSAHPGEAPAAADLDSPAATERVSGGSLVAAGPPPPATDSAELVTIQIVREDTRAPVPDAQVWQWASADFGSDDLAVWLPRGVVEEHLQDATSLRADSQGRVQVPSSPAGFSLMAVSGELWGCATFGGESTESAVLALTHDVDVRVRVVDRKGAPVLGAPVVLQQRRGPASFDLLGARTEAPDGVARLRHAGHFLRAAPGESFVVAVQGLLDPPLERPLDPGAAADEIVSLVLEPSGSCEVVVLTPDGQRLSGPLDATLSFADPSRGAAAPAVPDSLLRSRTGVDVLFEHVELGRQLAVSVRREGSADVLLASGPGPARPGERAILRVRVQADLAILRGRLVDANGAALGQLAAHARIESASGEPVGVGDWSLRTAPDGTFAVDCATWPDDGIERVLAVGRLSETGAEVAVARRPLPAGAGIGSHDLGDFVLEQAPAAVAGLVVDDQGRPVADAAITASLVDVGRVDDGPALGGEVGLAPTRSDAQGRFEVFGESGSADVALVARKASHVAGPVVAHRGDRSVRLVLGETGGLAGTVLIDDTLRDSMLLVQVEPGGPEPVPGDAPSQRPCMLDAAGQFAFRSLGPGTWRLQVVYAPTGSVLGEVDGLVVRAGEATRDPRLQPLDLRAAGRLIELELVDEAGEPVRGGRALSRPSGAEAERWSFASPVGGRLQLLSTGGPLDVAISAPAFLRTELEQVSASQRVVLRHAATLRLFLASGLRVPEPPLQLVVELTPVEPGQFSAFADSVSNTFDASGTLICDTPFTGDVRVELVVVGSEGPASQRAYVREDTPRILSVADHPFEQPFEIRFDPALLAQAVEEVLAER